MLSLLLVAERTDTEAYQPVETVSAFFNVAGTDTFFVLNDATRGVLDGATYTLAGDVATDISSYVREVSIRRGRARVLDEITVGVASVAANNFTRDFDPTYAAAAFAGNIIPGKHVEFATNGITIFSGYIDDWNFQYPLAGDSTVTFDVADDLAKLGGTEFDAWTTTAGETTGERLASVLDRTEVRYGSSRNIGTGVSTLQADNVSWGSNVLNYCQLVAKCDLGQLFAAKDGVLTFYGRDHTYTSVGAPLFSDDGTGIPYSGVELDYGTELLYNRVSVDATGFTKQTATDETSIETFGSVRSLSLSGLPLETEAQALGLAEYILTRYANPEARLASVTVLLHGLSLTDQTAVLNLDIGSVVQVSFTPNQIGTAVSKICLVEGIEHRISPAFHSVRLSLSNLAEGFVGETFILDDATAGVLDSAYVLSF